MSSSTGDPSGDAVYRKSLDCVHCGLCLTACPTYLETGRETSSPRGRIYLMRGVAEGRIPLGDVVAEEAFLCLGCRACETACPSGVEYGAMLELTRERVDRAGLRAGLARRVERFALRAVVPHPARLRALVGLVGLAQRLRLDRALLPLLPRVLRALHPLMPEIPAASRRAPLPASIPAQAPRRGRVALLSGCIASQLFADVNRATARVLSRNGFEVVVPGDQGCCGALQAHAGDLDFARGLARRNASSFAAADVDFVVQNSAGCGAAMRESSHWLPGERLVADVAAKVRDICELLDEAGLRDPEGPVAENGLRVCYDDPCHLLHAQRVSAAPRRLLARLPGIELVDHEEPGSCCGAAGIYNLTHREMSRSVLSRKLDALEKASPDVVATGNPGCLMQLRAGLRERGHRIRVVHPIELLDAAYGGEAAPGS